MPQVSARKRNAYRNALQGKGVPDVYAYMAAKEWHGATPMRDIETRSAGNLLLFGFVWSETKQGHEFWSAIASEAQ